MAQSASTRCPKAVAKRRLNVRAGPEGIHVFDRLTGANLLIDEAAVPPRLWSRAPRNVSIALTNSCDLACPFCYAPKKPATLDPSTVCRWLDELDDNGCFAVGFGGGEPTLSRHLPLLCRYITESTQMSATFTTHGHRLDETLAARLRGHVHFIRVSMDGIGATYEELRGRSFNSLLGQIPLIHSIAPFGLNFVVNERTLPDLEDAVSLAAELGAAEFLLLPEQPVGGLGGIDRSTSLLLQQWVETYHSPVRLFVSKAGSTGLPVCEPIANECDSRAYAHIDAMGILKRTSYDDSGISIHTGSILDALALLTDDCEDTDEDLERLRI